MREGSRDRSQIRLGVSGTDASIVAEGPLGGRKAGSWLVSARKSYLELLLKQITDDDDDFGFGFSDVQSKLVYDLSAAHRVELSLVAGRSRLDQETSIDDVNEVQDGRNSAALVNAGWRFTISPSLLLTQQRRARAARHRPGRVREGRRAQRDGARGVRGRDRAPPGRAASASASRRRPHPAAPARRRGRRRRAAAGRRAAAPAWPSASARSSPRPSSPPADERGSAAYSRRAAGVLARGRSARLDAGGTARWA